MNSGTRWKNGSIVEYIREYILSHINEGDWAPSDKIPSENELCATLGVSRSSVRSAIYALSNAGLLESRRGSGTYVCRNEPFEEMEIYDDKLSGSDRLSLYEFRRMIEATSAELAAQRATAQQVDEIKKSIVLMESALTDDERAYQDIRFHYLISKSTGNHYITSCFDFFMKSYEKLMRENIRVLGIYGTEGHREIVHAIETRNGELARRRMLEHLDNATGQYTLRRRRGSKGSAVE